MKKTILLYKKAKKELKYGNIEKSLEIANLLKEKQNSQTYQMIGGLFIDIGFYKKDVKLVKEGIAYFEDNFDKLKDDDLFYYNLANGYTSLLKLKKQNFKLGLNEKSFFNIKKYYNIALNNDLKESNKNEVLINLANTYNMLGRSLESLELYDEVLYNNPNESRALVNKAVTLNGFYNIVNHKLALICESYNYFKKSLKDDKLSFEFKNSAICNIKKIEGIVLDKSVLDKKFETVYTNKYDKYIVEFFRVFNLYLNPSTSKNYSIGDNILIDKTAYESSLNQVKNEYLTHRLNLALSTYKQINLKYTELNSDLKFDSELLRSSFIGFFNILDEIGFFINEYFDLELENDKINFSNVWYLKFDKNPKKRVINPKLSKLNNKGLYALFDIHSDFENGNCRYLKDNDILNLDDLELFKNSIKLSKITKNAIIYLIILVEVEKIKIN